MLTAGALQMPRLTVSPLTMSRMVAAKRLRFCGLVAPCSSTQDYQSTAAAAALHNISWLETSSRKTWIWLYMAVVYL